jgi:outer membrane receptor protein involved in Fe transport
VQVRVDGIRLPDFPESNIGAGNFTRDFVDLETIRRIEILRGPASALYGSDALGGVVAYTTKDPADYLGLTGRDVYASGRFGYSGADNSFSETVTGAFRSGQVEGMLLYTRRDGHELRVNGTYPTNPQNYAVNSLLGRLVWRATPADTLRLTGEFLERLTDTDVRTDRGTMPGMGGGPSTTVLDSEGRDRTQRVRLSLDYVCDAPLAFLDRVESRAYYTRLDRRERTDQDRAVFFGPAPPASPNSFRFSDFRQEQDILGTETQLNSTVELFGDPNRLTYGAIVERIETSRPRDRFETNLTTNAVTRTVAGETFPNKNFPDTTTWQAGAHLQDEVRAPPYDTANFGFTNRVQGYQILPSVNLEPERSDGFEAGFRGRFADGSSFQLVGFYNHYADFIATRVVGTSAGLTQFRYVNLSDVTIYGFEARGEWRFAPEWAARANAAYARGEDNDTGRPVDGVDPLRFIAGLAWRHPSGWGAEANLTLARRNTRTSEATYFKAPGYAVLDLAAYYDLRPNLTVNVGLFNVTDEKYFITQDVVGLSRTSPIRDLYAQPGRYAAVNVTLR